MTNEMKLIDVNKEINRIQSVLDKHQYEKDSTAYYVFSNLVECLQNIPAVDAAPVVHGHWLLEREPDGKPYCFHCSVCDGDFSYIGINTAYDYCPNCGAKMDGGSDETD